MLKNGVGEMFSHAEEWRVERKKKTHRLNQVYNSLPEDPPERRRELLDLRERHDPARDHHRKGCVIGAGSVVTRSIPPRSFAAGNPCRVIRTLTEEDSMKNKPYILGDCRVLKDE